MSCTSRSWTRDYSPSSFVTTSSVGCVWRTTAYVHSDSSPLLLTSVQVRDHIKMLLERKDKSLVDVMRVLIEYRQNIGDDDQPATAVVEEGEEKELTEVEEKQAILGQLILYLDSLDR